MKSASQSSPAKRLSFWRWFLAISLLLIVANSAMAAWLLASFLERRMLEQDATVSMQFVNSIVRVQEATAYFHGESMNPARPEMEEFFRHVANLPNVIRANVYGYDRSVLWSSDPDMIGKRFDQNDELERAFRGELAPEIETFEPGKKEEHASLPNDIGKFIEYYVPIWHNKQRAVIGTVEIYKNPQSLLAAIEQGQRYVWFGSMIAAAVLYLGLAIVVFNARRILREQEAANVEMERLAVVGEMASAVAHGLRNPLAAIRSCAELALDDDLTPDTRESLVDIVSQSDRLEGWIRSFLNRSQKETSGGADVIALDDVIRDCLAGFSSQMQARNIQSTFAPQGPTPLVVAQTNEIAQVINSVFSNSIEAIKRDGQVSIDRSRDERGMISVTVLDTGPGIPAELADQAIQPFTTTKPSGLGIGLALARRIMERMGGSIDLGNQPHSGARVRIRIPSARHN